MLVDPSRPRTNPPAPAEGGGARRSAGVPPQDVRGTGWLPVWPDRQARVVLPLSCVPGPTPSLADETVYTGRGQTGLQDLKTP